MHTSHKICIILTNIIHAHYIAADLKLDIINLTSFIANLLFTDSTSINLELWLSAVIAATVINFEELFIQLGALLSHV